MATTWLPLESNPQVLNKYIYQLGVSKDWNIVDVYGLDDELLEFIPKPVKALILLFPCSDAYEKHRAEEDAVLKETPPQIPDNIFYMKQIIHNACGTIALVHAIANNDIHLEDGVLKNYLDKARDLSPEERGKTLENDAAFTTVHGDVALEGQTEVPNVEDKINHHFITFIEKNGILYELDGRKSFPIVHGETSADTLVHDAAKICKQFMARDPEEVRFSVIALTATQN